MIGSGTILEREMKIALGVSGGIAAYKAAEIVRHLQDRGAQVQVIMIAAAQEFVRLLTFAALSGEKVITGLFGSSAEELNLDSAVEHIAVAQSIDCLLVALATADTIAKFAQGIANDFLSTLYLATTAPVVLAPAMNVNMWRGIRPRRRISKPFATAAYTSANRAAATWLVEWLARDALPNPNRLSLQRWSGLALPRILPARRC